MNRPQQFHLHGQRQIRHFVQKQRAAVCVLEEAQAVLVRTGKAAFFVTEEFAFHQVFGNRTAVHGDKRCVFARRKFVDAACSLLFTRTAFARDIHGHVGGGEFADELAHLLDLRRRAQKAWQVGRYGQTAAAGFVHDFFSFGGVQFGFAVGDGFHARFGCYIVILSGIGNGLCRFV